MTQPNETLVEIVKERYGRIAKSGSTGCCEPTCCGSSEDLGYKGADLAEVPKGADLGLGCGAPLAHLGLQPGETVLDLGSGAGIDVLEQEPPLADDPLLAAWRDPQHPAHHRLILNPHLAWYCAEGQRELRRKTAEACRRVLLGLPLRNIVN